MALLHIGNTSLANHDYLVKRNYLLKPNNTNQDEHNIHSDANQGEHPELFEVESDVIWIINLNRIAWFIWKYRLMAKQSQRMRNRKPLLRQEPFVVVQHKIEIALLPVLTKIYFILSSLILMLSLIVFSVQLLCLYTDIFTI